MKLFAAFHLRAHSMLRSLWNRSLGRLDGQYIRELNRIIDTGCESLLDVGSGFDSPVQHLHHRPVRMVGVDGFLPVIEKSRAKNIHDEYHQMSLLELTRQFARESFDCVLASDIIEHFPEDAALSLISQMEQVARRMTVIYTPNGFLPQGEKYGNPFQRHLSGWTVKTMESMGYSVIGIEGFRCLRGEMARIRWRPHTFCLALSLLSQLVTRNCPTLSFRILCVKLKVH